MKDKGKQLEMLFCWAAFYSNNKTLEVPTFANMTKYNKVQREINILRKELID